MRRTDRHVTDRAELLEILNSADVCRIALNTGAAPYIVPLNFGYKWTSELPELFFHCAFEGRKLDLLSVNNRAGFELDTQHELVTGVSACSWGMKYKSIIGTGTITEVTDASEQHLALDLIMQHYGSQQQQHEYEASVFDRTKMLKLTVLEMCGKVKR